MKRVSQLRGCLKYANVSNMRMSPYNYNYQFIIFFLNLNLTSTFSYHKNSPIGLNQATLQVIQHYIDS